MAVSKIHWRKQKALSMLAFRRRFRHAFVPKFTPGQEILLENSGVYIQNYLVAEALVDIHDNNKPVYIITEQD